MAERQPNSLPRNVNTVYPSPLHKLLDAAIRLKHHRKWGPGHEINFALEDLDGALADMGLTFNASQRDDKLARVDDLIKTNKRT